MSFTDVGILFVKRVCCFGTQLKELKKISNEAKQIINVMDMHDSEYLMTCTTAIPSISNTLNTLLLQ